MDDCHGTLPPHAQEGIRLFNAGEYFEAHEALETAWRAEAGPIRRLYQGILEAAVTYLHMRRGNYSGAIKVSERGMKWLNQWPDECRGVNVAKLRNDLTSAVDVWTRLGPDRVHEMDWSLLQPVEWNNNPLPSRKDIGTM
jgi:predicted metal-dependent hydrolase